MYFTNHPRYVRHDAYEEAIRRVVERLSRMPGLVSVFQIGSISSPGISDIDLLAIFEDNVVCHQNVLEGLPKPDRYLFTHDVNAMSLSHFRRAQQYTLYHNYRHRWGRVLEIGRTHLTTGNLHALKRQVALEFLIVNYVVRSVELTYGLFSIRNLLLSINALKYDLEFLNITSGPFYELVMRFIAWRNAWFVDKIENQQLACWAEAFGEELPRFLQMISEKHKLYLPEHANLHYSRHIRLKRAENIGYRHRGIILPPILSQSSKRLVRLQHRFNRFEFAIPATSKSRCSFLAERFEFMRDIWAYKRAFFKHFSLPSCKLGV